MYPKLLESTMVTVYEFFVQFYVFPRASFSGIHKTAFRVQIQYTLESHATTITWENMIALNIFNSDFMLFSRLCLWSYSITHLSGITYVMQLL